MLPHLTRASDLLSGQVGMTHRFVVCIDQSRYEFGSWTRVSGLQVNWETHRHRAGDVTDEQVYAGNVSYQNITLSRAACFDSATVKDWLATTSTQRQPLSGAIHMLDFTGLPVVTWELRSFFPVGWSITGFDAASAQPAIEELQLAHNGFLDIDRQG